MANDTVAVKKAAPKKAAAAPRKAPAKKVTATPRLAPLPPEGWYPDPADRRVLRYWDGEGWDDDLGTVPADETPPAPTSTQQAAGGESSGDGGGADPGTITFRGRVMRVRRPGEDQLALWQRIATRAQAFQREAQTPKPCPECKGTGVGADEDRCGPCAGTGDANTTAALRLYNQALNIVMSVLVDEGDRDWVEDELIAGTVDLIGASEIVGLTVSALVTGRVTAPRNGPVRKARRRR